MPRKRKPKALTQDVAVQALINSGGNVSKARKALAAAGYRAKSRGPLIRHRDEALAAGRDVPLPPWVPSRGEVRPPADELADDAKPLVGGQIGGVQIVKRPLPRPGHVRRYILTSAQNNTEVLAPFWQGLVTLAERFKAEILVSPIRYNLNAYRRMGADTDATEPDEFGGIWYADAVRPHLNAERIELAPGLHWCGDIRTSATAANPLSGRENISGSNSIIVAGTSLAMRSVATPKDRSAQFNMSTGVVTQRNYSDTPTGAKASWHHAYAALMIEVDDAGDWYPWFLNADQETGAFNYPGLVVTGDRVVEADNIAAVTFGDIHAVKLDPRVTEAIAGQGGLIDDLRPGEAHLHDLHDHETRNHHHRGRPVERYRLHKRQRETIGDELRHSVAFIEAIERPGMAIRVIDSNHHDAIQRTIEEEDWRKDPVNARFILQAADRLLEAIDEGEDGFCLFEWCLRRLGVSEEVHFLRPDESCEVEGVECSYHSHVGANGSRGSLGGFARMGMKSNIGHGHGPGIHYGAYQAGVTGGELETLDMGYNKGPSSWARAHIGTYRGGKRTIILMRGVKHRATGAIEDARAV